MLDMLMLIVLAGAGGSQLVVTGTIEVIELESRLIAADPMATLVSISPVTALIAPAPDETLTAGV